MTKYLATQNLWRTAAGRLAARIAPTALGGRLVLTLMLMLLTTASAWARTFSGGSGTEADPYKIASADDLQQLAANVNNGTTFENVYFRQTADIDGGDSDVTPVTPEA